MDKQINKWIRLIQKKSDREAADCLISHYYKEIYAYAFKQTSQKELAQDLTQEIFMNALQSIQGFDAKRASFRTWLYKIATYKIVDYYRSKAHREQTVELSEEVAAATQNLFHKLELEQIQTFVQQLDALNQQIYRLKLYAEHSFLEISQTLGLPESTVKTRYYATLKLIRETFKEED